MVCLMSEWYVSILVSTNFTFTWKTPALIRRLMHLVSQLGHLAPDIWSPLRRVLLVRSHLYASAGTLCPLQSLLPPGRVTKMDKLWLLRAPFSGSLLTFLLLLIHNLCTYVTRPAEPTALHMLLHEFLDPQLTSSNLRETLSSPSLSPHHLHHHLKQYLLSTSAGWSSDQTKCGLKVWQGRAIPKQFSKFF